MSQKTLVSFLLLSSLLHTTLAVEYKVVNSVPSTPGGARFNSEIGATFTAQTIKTINQFIWKIFKQTSPDQRKNVPVVTVNITILTDGALAEIGEDNIYVDAPGIDSWGPGQAKFQFTSLMYHETTHVFQWSGKGTAPGGLTEGIADYIRIKSNYYDKETYTKPGEGNKWDEGYGVTARFLEYCDSLRDGFTADLNNKMREVFKEEYFQDLLGKPLDQVWKEYKAKYGQ